MLSQSRSTLVYTTHPSTEELAFERKADPREGESRLCDILLPVRHNYSFRCDPRDIGHLSQGHLGRGRIDLEEKLLMSSSSCKGQREYSKAAAFPAFPACLA